MTKWSNLGIANLQWRQQRPRSGDLHEEELSPPSSANLIGDSNELALGTTDVTFPQRKLYQTRVLVNLQGDAAPVV